MGNGFKLKSSIERRPKEIQRRKNAPELWKKKKQYLFNSLKDEEHKEK